MSNFLKLVEENTPGLEDHRTPEENAKINLTSILKNAGYEADYKTFSDEVVITFGDGTIATVEVKRVFKPKTKDGVPEVDAEEDFESPALQKKRLAKLENDKSMIGNATKALAAGKEVKAASDPKRPSRGVKKIDNSIDKMAFAVSKAIDRVTKSLK